MQVAGLVVILEWTVWCGIVDCNKDVMISLVVHGGVGDISKNLVSDQKEGVRRALKVGWDILSKGGSSLDAVEAAIVEMENNDVFDAGRGSFMNAAGEIELDASMMDGKNLRAGAIAAVQSIKNPIVLARMIMEKSEHVLLVGIGATRFALEHGVQTCRPDDLIVPRELERWKNIQRQRWLSARDLPRQKKIPGDTVGAIALDRQGNLASGTSTGGVPNKHPGRVSDSPLIGCATYADNDVGAVSSTGWGEGMIRVVMAKSVIDLMEANEGDPVKAVQEGMKLFKRKVNGFGGIIALNTKGEIGIEYNTVHMARGYMTSQLKSPVVAV